jgi:hypothetical protein
MVQDNVEISISFYQPNLSFYQPNLYTCFSLWLDILKMAQLHLSVLLLLLLATIQVALAELQNGRYKIVSAAKSAPPPSPLGINPRGPVSPVITGGIEQVWTVRKLEDGFYVISIEQEGGDYVLKNNDRDIIADIFPPPAKWRVAKHQDGFYTIELPSIIWPSRAIYLPNSAPGARLQLGIYEIVPPPNFLWEFIPADEMRYKGRGCGQDTFAY